MASSVMKFVLIFITMLLQLIFCSSWPVNFGEAVNGAGKLGNELAHSAETERSEFNNHIPQETYKTVPKTTPDNLYSLNKQPKPTFHENIPQSFGETLAEKYFGNKFIKGFRWGYRVGKRIHSVAQRCDDFTQALKDSLCPQFIQTSPLPNSAIVNCIVEVTTFNKTCIQPYESDKYPPEATCELDYPDKLDSNYCAQN
ncbi:hypothetical protein Hdeb2414_s0009g00321161 [Helianthus debilis subsp. tardiflorus]